MLIYADEAKRHVAEFHKVDEEEYYKLQDRISEKITLKAKNGKTGTLIPLEPKYNIFQDVILKELYIAGYTANITTTRTPNGESMLNISWK